MTKRISAIGTEQGDTEADKWVQKQTKSGLCRSVAPGEMSKLAHAERARRLKVISKETPLPLETKARHSKLVVGALMEAQKPNDTWGLIDPVRRGSWTVDTPSFAALLDLDAEHAEEDIVTVQTGLGGAFFSVL